MDQATALALNKKLEAVNTQAANQAMTQAASVQTLLKLVGYWTGPIDGQWTPALTDAVKKFQTDLGVEPTGAVDAATLAAFEQAVAAKKEAAATTTTAAPPPTTAPPATTAAPAPTSPATPATTIASTPSST